MPIWLHWIHNRVKKFDMFGSIWFANMDCLVGNVQYLYDDGNKYQQPSEPYFANKSDEPEQCNQSTSHNCPSHANRTCNCAGSKCTTDGDDGYYFGSNTGTKYYDDVGYRGKTDYRSENAGCKGARCSKG